MPSPFPGMDPYLEEAGIWSDARATLIPLIREALISALPTGYWAKIEQYAWLEDVDEERVRHGKPDVFVLQERSPRTHPTRTEFQRISTSGIAVTLPAKRKQKGNRFISIIDRGKKSVITVIELFGPSNQEGRGREIYLNRRMEYLSADINLVEIDLMRSGSRIPMSELIPASSDYFIFSCRAEDYPKATVWPFTIRDPIPTFPVPLRKEHPSPILDLRPCLDRAYDSARHGNEIDYSRPPVPPLRVADAEWANDLLKKPARKRKK